MRGKGKLTDEELQMLRDIRIHRILGIKDNGRRFSMSCPIHNGHNTTAFSVYPDNTFHCFNCKAHGSGAIDFVKQLLECSFEKAIEELAIYL
jgi:DNA primase